MVSDSVWTVTVAIYMCSLTFLSNTFNCDSSSPANRNALIISARPGPIWQAYHYYSCTSMKYITESYYTGQSASVLSESSKLNTTLINKSTYPVWLWPVSGWCSCELWLELSLQLCTSDTSEDQRWCSWLCLELTWTGWSLMEMMWLICWYSCDIVVPWTSLQCSCSSRS